MRNIPQPLILKIKLEINIEERSIRGTKKNVQ